MPGGRPKPIVPQEPTMKATISIPAERKDQWNVVASFCRKNSINISETILTGFFRWYDLHKSDPEYQHKESDPEEKND